MVASKSHSFVTRTAPGPPSRARSSRPWYSLTPMLWRHAVQPARSAATTAIHLHPIHSLRAAPGRLSRLHPSRWPIFYHGRLGWRTSGAVGGAGRDESLGTPDAGRAGREHAGAHLCSRTRLASHPARCHGRPFNAFFARFASTGTVASRSTQVSKLSRIVPLRRREVTPVAEKGRTAAPALRAPALD